jgi:hypothetical protein
VVWYGAQVIRFEYKIMARAASNKNLHGAKRAKNDVSFTDAIPSDYDGVMGVPISFLDKYSPEQFEIVSSNDIRLNDKIPFKDHGLIKDKDGTINGKPTYVRVVIRHKK